MNVKGGQVLHYQDVVWCLNRVSVGVNERVEEKAKWNLIKCLATQFHSNRSSQSYSPTPSLFHSFSLSLCGWSTAAGRITCDEKWNKYYMYTPFVYQMKCKKQHSNAAHEQRQQNGYLNENKKDEQQTDTMSAIKWLPAISKCNFLFPSNLHRPHRNSQISRWRKQITLAWTNIHRLSENEQRTWRPKKKRRNWKFRFRQRVLCQ